MPQYNDIFDVKDTTILTVPTEVASSSKLNTTNNNDSEKKLSETVSSEVINQNTILPEIHRTKNIAVPPQPYKRKSFNVSAVDTTPITPDVVPLVKDTLSKGKFSIPPVDTAIIYDDLPSDEEIAITSSTDSIKKVLEPSKLIINDITTYIKGQNITPIPYTKELEYDKQQYFFDNENQAYLLNEEQIGDVYRIILSLNSSEVFSKTIKGSPILHQHKKKIMKAIENPTNYFAKAIPTHILTQLILHAISFFYMRSLTTEAVQLNQNRLLLRMNNVINQLGNLVLDCFININILQKESSNLRIVNTNSYKNVVVYDKITDEALKNLLIDFDHYNISKLRRLEEEHIINCKITNEQDFKVIQSYLKLHAQEVQALGQIEKTTYQNLRLILNKTALDIGNHLIELLAEDKIIKIVPIDLSPHPETKALRKNIPHIEFTSKSTDFLVTSSSFAKPRLTTTNVRTTFQIINDESKEINIDIKKPSNIFMKENTEKRTITPKLEILLQNYNNTPTIIDKPSLFFSKPISKNTYSILLTYLSAVNQCLTNSFIAHYTKVPLTSNV